MAYKVANDAGHGSNTAGKRTPDGYREHWINVKCASYFDIAMKRCGIQTVKVSWDDTDATDDANVSLATRQKQIKNAKCDISVSWHANAHGNGSIYTSGQGIETLIHNNASKVRDSKNLATKIQSYLIKGTNQKNRGVKTDNLAMCNCVAMGTKASVLIEIGFMTNKYEAELMKTDAFCLECAEEAAQGVCAYLGVKYISPSVSNANTNVSPSTSVSSKVVITNFIPTKGNATDFTNIIKNIKSALNTDYDLKFIINGTIDDILLTNLGNVILSTSFYKPNITYALQQLLKWWGYNLSLDGAYDSGTRSTVSLFQSQVGIPQTGTTTKEFWYKILGR